MIGFVKHLEAFCDHLTDVTGDPVFIGLKNHFSAEEKASGISMEQFNDRMMEATETYIKTTTRTCHISSRSRRNASSNTSEEDSFRYKTETGSPAYHTDERN